MQGTTVEQKINEAKIGGLDNVIGRLVKKTLKKSNKKLIITASKGTRKMMKI